MAQRGRVSRVHWLMPGRPGTMRRIACHLTAGPGEFTSEPNRVTCTYCLGKPEYRRADLASLAEQICDCGHRRGDHIGARGEKACVKCEGSSFTGGHVCKAFEPRKEVA